MNRVGGLSFRLLYIYILYFIYISSHMTPVQQGSTFYLRYTSPITRGDLLYLGMLAPQSVIYYFSAGFITLSFPGLYLPLFFSQVYINVFPFRFVHNFSFSDFVLTLLFQQVCVNPFFLFRFVHNLFFAGLTRSFTGSC